MIKLRARGRAPHHPAFADIELMVVGENGATLRLEGLVLGCPVVIEVDRDGFVLDEVATQVQAEVDALASTPDDVAAALGSLSDLQARAQAVARFAMQLDATLPPAVDRLLRELAGASMPHASLQAAIDEAHRWAEERGVGLPAREMARSFVALAASLLGFAVLENEPGAIDDALERVAQAHARWTAERGPGPVLERARLVALRDFAQRLLRRMDAAS